MVASVWLGPNSTTVFVESQEAVWEQKRFKVKRFKMKVSLVEAEMKVLPLTALYSRTNPVMGLSPSNPGVQTRENVLSLTSINLTTGGSGSTERCSRRNNNSIKNNDKIMILSLGSQKMSVCSLTWGHPGGRVAVSPHCGSSHRSFSRRRFQVVGTCGSVHPRGSRNGSCVNLKHGEKKKPLEPLELMKWIWSFSHVLLTHPHPGWSRAAPWKQVQSLRLSLPGPAHRIW